MKELLKKFDALKAQLKEYRAKLEADQELSVEEQEDFDAKLKAFQSIKMQIATAQSFDSLDIEEEEELGPVASVSGYSERKTERLPNSIPAPSQVQEPATIEEFLHLAFYEKKKANQVLEYRNYSSEQRFDTGSKGGFVIPTRLIAGIREYSRSALNVRSEAMIIPAGTPPDSEVQLIALDQEAVDGVNRIEGGVEINWINEGDTKPNTDTNYRMISLRPEEVAGIIPLTDKLVRNAAAMVAYVSKRLGIAVAHAEEAKFFTGTGIGTPTGFINSNASLAINRAVANTISFADIKAMEPFIYDPMGTAKFYGNRAVKEQLLSIVGDGGGATNMVKLDQSTGQITIYGRPFRLTPYTSAFGSLGDFCLVNFSEYAVKDGSGPIVETGYRSNDWAQNKTSVKITSNVDGKPMNVAPFAEEDNTLISPFVLLDVPA
jgi:HK97 family phage major capsid protein